MLAVKAVRASLVFGFTIAFLSDTTFLGKLPTFFVIVAPTYNNMGCDELTGEPLCLGHIKSVIRQDYPYWHMIIIDDCSSDGTGVLLEHFIQSNNLQDRVTVHHNSARRKALYNIWSTVHALPDETIAVCLDGDDELYDEHVLTRVAQEYGDPRTWLTYGQYEYYPSSEVGVCADIPARVYTNKKLRDYDWVTSHLRTFKAWLFKQIALKDLLIDGQFFSMGWDVAVLLPMLEMAGKEHVRFIPDILYRYKATPYNDHVINRALQVEMDQYIREGEPYQRLEKPIFTQDYAHAQVDLIVFSKDRPMQLYAFLESLKKQVRGLGAVSVIYHAQNGEYESAYKCVAQRFAWAHFTQQCTQAPQQDFKNITMRLLKDSPSDYIVFAVDDIIVKDHVDMAQCIGMLEKTKAYGIYLRLGLHTVYCYNESLYQGVPPGELLGDNFYCWQFYKSTGDWAYPNTVDMTLYCKDRLISFFEAITFTAPNDLEYIWALGNCPDLDHIGICYRGSKIINVPLNSVQQLYGQNYNMGGSLDELLEKFKSGYRIDIKFLEKIKNISAHAEYEFVYRRERA